MVRFAWCLVLVSIACASCYADEPIPEPSPDPIGESIDPLIDEPTDEPLVIFPTKTIPKPAPLPTPVDPRTVTTLGSDEIYVVESKIELILREFGTGKVKILETSGPRVIPAKFAGGGGAFEVREFDYPYLYFVTSAKPGLVEIDFIPGGVTKATEAKIVRQTLTLSEFPQPPPQPEPKPLPVPPEPEPEPTPPAPQPDDTLVDHVHLSIVQDTRNVSLPTATTLNGLYGWETFITSGSSYLLYDITTKEKGGTKAIADIKADGSSYPAITVRDKATDKLLDVTVLPGTVSDLKVYVNSFLRLKL